jgi:DUF971 family protein
MLSATEIRLDRSRQVLHVAFGDDSRFSIPAELLRVESPSAEVQGHNAEQKRIVPGCRAVAITAIEAVGNYAVRLTFDDGHDTGLYSWDYLHTLGRDQTALLEAYVAALRRQGLSRDPPGRPAVPSDPP